MNIKTKDFGFISAEQQDIIKFTSGIYGFEEYREYIILKDNPNDNIMYLQSVEKEDLHFVLIDPYSVMIGYNPGVCEDDLNDLRVRDETELKFLVIAIITEDVKESLVNLKSPIAINPQSREAKQIILLNSEYHLKHSLFRDNG